MNREINTDEVLTILKISINTLDRIKRNEAAYFPAPVRIGGTTNRTKFYDEDAVLRWQADNDRDKLKQTNELDKDLVSRFLSGKFDAHATQIKNLSMLITARQNKPTTRKIHVKSKYDEIVWPNNFWSGL